MEFWEKLIVLIQKILKLELFSVSGKPFTLIEVMILIVAIVASIFLGRLARKFTNQIIVARGTDYKGVGYSLGVMAQYTVTVSGILLALNNAGVSLTALAAFGAILTVGIGFGLQNIAQNFISGIILLVERPVQQGDFIIIGDTVGTVQSISMRATKVVSRDNVVILVPNSKLISETVINQSASRSAYRARVSIGVAYGSNTELVREALMQVAHSIKAVRADPPARVFFRDFGDSSLLFELVIWLDSPGPEPLVTSDIRFEIDREFRRRGIEIPFPQRDIHIRSDATRPT